MNMKAIVLALALVIGMMAVACGNKDNERGTEATGTETVTVSDSLSDGTADETTAEYTAGTSDITNDDGIADTDMSSTAGTEKNDPWATVTVDLNGADLADGDNDVEFSDIFGDDGDDTPESSDAPEKPVETSVASGTAVSGADSSSESRADEPDDSNDDEGWSEFY